MLGTPELTTLAPRRRLVLLCATAAAPKHHAPAAYNTDISGEHCPGPSINHLQAQVRQC